MRNLVLLFLIFLSSCQHAETKKIAFDFYPPMADSIKIGFLQPEIRLSRFFNLQELYKGVDSFEIRIRYWDVFDLGYELLVLRADSMGWKGYHYTSYTLFHTTVSGKNVMFDDMYKIGDSVFLVKEFTPILGWKNFNDSLLNYKLDKLPTQYLIKNFTPLKGIVDGDGYTIEIATPHSYRILSYITPDSYQNEECQTIVKFINFLNRQVDIQNNFLPIKKNTTTRKPV